MLLKLGAHTDTPAWSSRTIEMLFKAGLSSPGAELGDIVQALFGILSECQPGISDPQANLIREIGTFVAGKHRRAYAAEDFSWLVRLIAERDSDITAAQAYLAACVLPPSLVPGCRELILDALRPTRFADEVARWLND
jgi:hypothetical protein